MSDFTDKENSLNESSPAECFYITDGFENYYYCNVEQSVSIPSVGVFVPAIIKRDDSEDQPNGFSSTFKFSISLNEDFCRKNVVRFGKPRMNLVVYRVQRDVSGYEIMFKGIITDISFDGEVVSVSASTIGEDFTKKILTRHAFRICYHSVYGAGDFWFVACNAIRENFTYTGVIESFGSSQAEITSSIFQEGVVTPVPNRAYLGILKNNVTNETRIIYENPSLYTVKIIRPFVGGAVGNSISFTLGCAKTIGACKRINTPNLHFAGFPEMPIEDPYSTTALKRYTSGV